MSAVAPVSLAKLSDRAIAELIREHDEAIDEARSALIERFKRYDAEIVKLGGGKDGGKDGGGKVSGPGTPGGVVKPDKVPGGGRAPGDIRLGDEARRVRASKIALARLLKDKGTGEHAKLRRGLRREALGAKRGNTATRQWERAVRAAQHILRLPVTGVMDTALQDRLRRYWPSDSALRRLLRSSGGWRLIKGQLSPNFNLREFTCKDGTPYIEGLMREQKLSRQQAKARARELATRLERVRRAGGGRGLNLNSVYRTVAHNAKQPGAATNSAHLRGFAADIARPDGVTLTQHRANVRAAFPRVGFYPNGDFVHGDFDASLPQGEWNGP